MKKEFESQESNVERRASKFRSWFLAPRPSTLRLLPFAFGIGRAPQIVLALVTLVFALPAAPTNSHAPKAAGPVAKNEATAPAALPPPPQSVFIVPKKSTEGKDPFFPTATRVYNTETPVQPKGPVVTIGNLSLKGISGTALEPLAIINTTTFTTGEENDVITSAGRMRVRCVEINMALGTALVQVGGERRELRLQPKK
jgi:hypothetical protein